MQVADGLNLQTNLPGSQLFQNSGGDVFGALQQLITSLQSGTATDAGTATNQLRSAFDFITGQRIFYGNAVNQLNSTQTYLQQEQVTLEIAGEHSGGRGPHQSCDGPDAGNHGARCCIGGGGEDSAYEPAGLFEIGTYCSEAGSLSLCRSRGRHAELAKHLARIGYCILAENRALHARSFGTEVPQDDALLQDVLSPSAIHGKLTMSRSGAVRCP